MNKLEVNVDRAAAERDNTVWKSKVSFQSIKVKVEWELTEAVV